MKNIAKPYEAPKAKIINIVVNRCILDTSTPPEEEF